MVKQFAKLGVQLEVRATDYNQFQDKVRKGKHQIFWWGWLADYPDAENFLFLLYGPNGKTRSDGENTANYENPEYDKLFAQMKLLDDGPEKQKVIDQMVTDRAAGRALGLRLLPVLRRRRSSSGCTTASRPILIRDHGRYYRVDPPLRVAKQARMEPAGVVAAGAAGAGGAGRWCGSRGAASAAASARPRAAKCWLSARLHARRASADRR